MLINSNPKDTREAILADAQKNGITAPILQDDVQLVGEQLGATPRFRSLRGRSQDMEDRLSRPACRLMRSRLSSAGKEVKVASAAAKGATIDFPARSAKAKAEFAKISYSDTIAPLLEEKCIACHQQGGIAPFAMDSYEKVKGFAPMMREAIRTDRMPPFDADPHVGKFKDDKSLSSDEIKTLVHWIEAGAPRGDGRRTSWPRSSTSLRNGRSASRTWSSIFRSTPSRRRAMSTTSTRRRRTR